MALGIGKIIETAFMRSIDVEFVDDRIQVGRGLLVIPLIVVAHAQIGFEARIQFIFIIELLKK